LPDVEIGQQAPGLEIDRRPTWFDPGQATNTLLLSARWPGPAADGRLEGAAYRKPLSINDGNRIVGAIARNDKLAIRGNFANPGAPADPNGRDDRPFRQVDDGNIRRTGIGDVSSLAVGGNRDVIRFGVDAHGRDHLVAFGVDDADVAGTALAT